MSDLLPTGVHPRDMTSDDPFGSDMPAPHDQGAHRGTRGSPPWSWHNAKALGTFQRLAGYWAAGVRIVGLEQGSTAKIVGTQPGRTRLTIWVPSSYFPGGSLTTTPAGVIVSSDEGQLQLGNTGIPLFVGDALDISSEDGVWAGLQPGTELGVVCYLHCWDPPPAGGGL